MVIALTTPLNNDCPFSKEHSEHMAKHGDGVKDIALTVENCEQTFKVAVQRGAKPIREPTKIEDKNGVICVATVQTYGDTTHTFVQRDGFSGVFMPGFVEQKQDAINEVLGTTEYGFIDHIVGNHAVGDMEATVQWYEKMLDFHRFWSIDDSIIHTEYR